MEKHEIIESTQLPKVMIQHIQSFLGEKEATRTAILSKSWYTAWLTRPNLDLDEYYMQENYKISASTFMKFVKQTLQRYNELNLKIQIFKLRMHASLQIISLATRWTTNAMKLGASDLHIKFLYGANREFVLPLPREVLESETLVRLSVSDCRIDPNQKVRCSRLKSLNLCSVCVEGDTLSDIISMCRPLIEELVLSLCTCSYDNSPCLSRGVLVLKPKLGLNDFHKLKVLSLEKVEIGELFFRDFSSKFPRLKDLDINNCTGCEKIKICSNSLERVALCQSDKSRILRVKFDVPRIRRFEFTSTCISSFVPSLTFKTTSREWKSNITFSSLANSSWFFEFRKFLLELSSSKIYLSLYITNTFSDEAYEYASHMISLPKPPILEILYLYFHAPSSVQSALFEELFWSCRPNLIMMTYVKKYDIVQLICNTLIKEECGMHDLEEVNVEISGHTAWAWSRPPTIKTPQYASTFAYPESVDRYTHVHIQLKWG